MQNLPEEMRHSVQRGCRDARNSRRSGSTPPCTSNETAIGNEGSFRRFGITEPNPRENKSEAALIEIELGHLHFPQRTLQDNAIDPRKGPCARVTPEWMTVARGPSGFPNRKAPPPKNHRRSEEKVPGTFRRPVSSLGKVPAPFSRPRYSTEHVGFSLPGIGKSVTLTVSFLRSTYACIR
jgi:hypothetical protein